MKPRRLSAISAQACQAWLWRRARAGNGIWLACAVTVSGLRLLSKWSKREREVVYRRKLAKGERLTIRHLDRRADAAEPASKPAAGPAAPSEPGQPGEG